MFQYTVKRLLSTIPVLLGISVMLFFMLRALPGDPAQVIAGDMATQKEVELIRHQLGLDRPTYIQYGHFLWRLMLLDLGNSIKTQNPVITEILPRLKNTAILAVTATLLACLFGIPAGIVAAVRPYSVWDILVTSLALFGISMPAFWLGLMLIVMFSVKLQWLPVGGSGGIQFLVLPSITLASLLVAAFARKHAIQHDGDPDPGLHHHGTLQGTERAGGYYQACPEERIDSGCDHYRIAVRRAAGRNAC